MLFDLDGTLIDSVPDIACAVNAMLVEFDRPTHDVETVRGWVGRGLSVLIHRVLTGGDDAAASADEHANAVSAFRRHYASCCTSETLPFDGAVELLNWLPTAGVRVAVVTNKPTAFARQIIETLALNTDLVIGAEPHRPLKPDPSAVFEAVDALGGGVGWMVGDTTYDRDAARAAGARFIGVELEGDQGRNISQHTSEDEPVFASLQSLHRWLADEVLL
jgi:phosphoglycolate phosphatase